MMSVFGCFYLFLAECLFLFMLQSRIFKISSGVRGVDDICGQKITFRGRQDDARMDGCSLFFFDEHATVQLANRGQLTVHKGLVSLAQVIFLFMVLLM